MSVTEADRGGLWICARVAALGFAMSSLAPTPSCADAPIVGEYLQLPSIAQPTDTPNALNRVAFLRSMTRMPTAAPTPSSSSRTG